MTMRGLIKIEPVGGGGLLYTMASINDFLAEYTPIADSFSNWLRNKQGDYGSQDQMRDNQQAAAYLKGGYALYGEELEILFHKSQTDGYYGIEDYGQNGGNQEVVHTNETSYREIKFKTTISIRDPDLPIGPVDAARRGDMWGILTQTITYGIDSLLGVDELKAYFKKRANFLRDLDDVEVKVSSLMFNPLIGYITADRMTMQAGQTEAQYDVGVKEVVKAIVSDPKVSTGAVTIEPGLGFT